MLAVVWILVALGVAYWGLVCAAGIRTSSALRRATDEAPTADLPSLTIVVAARDEARTMRHEAAALAAIEHPALEVVLVDDRSTDGTGALMDELAARDPRIRVVHVEHLPEGWLGKVHALEQGRRAARGEWLLFTDADVELAPQLPRHALAMAQRYRLDALALLPSVHSDGILVGGAVVTFSRWLLFGSRLWRAADPEHPSAFGVGACNFVRASALERAGGLGWLRMDVADDAALGQLIAAQGGRTMLASGVGLVRVRWQESVRGMVRGFEKYGGTGGIGSVRAAIGLASLALLGELAPWVALGAGAATGATDAAWLAAATIAISSAVGIVTGARAGAPLRGFVAGPVGPIVVWWMQVRSAVLEHRRGGVVWRGTFYSTEQLRAGKRYRLPGLTRAVDDSASAD